MVEIRSPTHKCSGYRTWRRLYEFLTDVKDKSNSALEKKINFADKLRGDIEQFIVRSDTLMTRINSRNYDLIRAFFVIYSLSGPVQVPEWSKNAGLVPVIPGVPFGSAQKNMAQCSQSATQYRTSNGRLIPKGYLDT